MSKAQPTPPSSTLAVERTPTPTTYSIRVDTGSSKLEQQSFTSEVVDDAVESAVSYMRRAALTADVARVSPALHLTYTCTTSGSGASGTSATHGGSACNFDAALMHIRQSHQLEHSGAQDLAQVTVASIANNQQRYTPEQLGGFLLVSKGQALVYLQNATIDNTNNDVSCGYISLSDMRMRLVRYRAAHKQREARLWLQLGFATALLGAGVVAYRCRLHKRFYNRVAPWL
jgi:hypothetical protein